MIQQHQLPMLLPQQLLRDPPLPKTTKHVISAQLSHTIPPTPQVTVYRRQDHSRHLQYERSLSSIDARLEPALVECSAHGADNAAVAPQCDESCAALDRGSS